MLFIADLNDNPGNAIFVVTDSLFNAQSLCDRYCPAKVFAFTNRIEFLMDNTRELTKIDRQTISSVPAEFFIRKKPQHPN
jgi:hypothetical protein